MATMSVAWHNSTQPPVRPCTVPHGRPSQGPSRDCPRDRPWICWDALGRCLMFPATQQGTLLITLCRTMQHRYCFAATRCSPAAVAACSRERQPRCWPRSISWLRCRTTPACVVRTSTHFPTCVSRMPWNQATQRCSITRPSVRPCVRRACPRCQRAWPRSVPSTLSCARAKRRWLPAPRRMTPRSIPTMQSRCWPRCVLGKTIFDVALARSLARRPVVAHMLRHHPGGRKLLQRRCL